MPARPPGSPDRSTHTYLVPWREEPVPQSEWWEVPAANADFSATSNLVYYFKDTQLLAMKFDPKTKRVGQPYEVKLAPGSLPVLKPDDTWQVRGPGIIFTRQETKSSVWLLRRA